MSIFSRCTLTRMGRNLIAKTQLGRTSVNFSKARVGDGIWMADEELQEATAIKNPRREYAFSDIIIPDENPSNVTLQVVIHNRGQESLFYVTEMGIYAQDPDLGEILYAVLAADNQYIYLPEENGVGISQIVERVNLEVANATAVTINSTGAVVSAIDFLELRRLFNRIKNGLEGGVDGQILEKTSADDYAMKWKDKEQTVTTSPSEKFPKAGKENALYIDDESSEFYIWKDEKYFKLPVGSEASATLQKQITENKKSIENMGIKVQEVEKKFTETNITIDAAGWVESEEDGVIVYTHESAVAGMTKKTKAQIWPRIISEIASQVIEEMNAISIFWGNGRSFSEDEKIVLKCYRRRPTHEFGITVIGA